jgi:choline monooxygenase
MSRFDIDPDITTASTLDKRFYLDESAYAQARERIFARSWQWIGDTTDVAAPASLSPREMLPGLLDEPLLLARDGGGTLRCLSNVCTHRGNLLVQAPCRGEQIRCGYHSRRFDLAGRMLFMPEFQQAKNFPSASDHLPQLAFGELGPLAFAAIDPAVPFDGSLGDIPQRLAWLPLSEFKLDPSHSRDYEFPANWALYVENYLEACTFPSCTRASRRRWTSATTATSCSATPTCSSPRRAPTSRPSSCRANRPSTASASRPTPTGCSPT